MSKSSRASSLRILFPYIKLFGYCTILLGSLIVCSNKSEAHSVTEAMNGALQNNPKIQSFLIDFQISHKARYDAIAAFLPRVIVRMNSSSSSTSAMNNSAGVLDFGSFNTGVALKQQLFNGFSDFNNLRRAEASIAASEQEMLLLKQGILLEVVKSYFEVIRRQKIVELLTNIVSLFEKELKISEKRFKVGDITKQDMAKSKFELANARSELILSQNELLKSQSSYNALTGLDPEEVTMDMEQALASTPETFQEVLKLAGERNPQIIVRSCAVEAAKRTLSASYGRLLPSVNVTFGAGISSNNGLGLENGYGLLEVDIPIFTSGTAFSEISTARKFIIKSEYELSSEISKVREAATVAWNDLQSSYSIIKAEAEAQSLAKVVLDTLKQEYKLKLSALADVLKAEMHVMETSIRIINAQANKNIAVYRVLQVIGNIS